MDPKESRVQKVTWVYVASQVCLVRTAKVVKLAHQDLKVTFIF